MIDLTEAQIRVGGTPTMELRLNRTVGVRRIACADLGPVATCRSQLQLLHLLHDLGL